ncbi:Histone deacetylase 4 [Caenorhabditis elegans]|nr:Histone deacetylase 4 [Caenorhabditis elegans]CCF23337.1 Histone deacetylase 4 [Caenorhabditis elegans]|eukprot:NP_001257279.1 Histone deacetylase 4 [Caenorhabditis elegans]
MDLIGHFQRAQQELSVQHMHNLYAALQQQQQLQNLQTERSAVNPLLISQQHSTEDQNSGPAAPLSLANSLTNLLSSSNGNLSVPQTPTKEHHPTAPTSNRKCDLPRSNSTTISQLTKDRLKNMIANRSKGESNSQSNLMSNSVTANGNGHDNGRKLKNSNSQVNVSSPHFEPYRLPTSLANAHNLQQASEFQLRKVNSEPNLKMRIRAKLLSKGSSPVQHVQQNNSQFNFTHPQLKRSDSETSQNVPLDFMQSSSQTNLPHLMLPSPSLPNLAAAGAFHGLNLPVGQDLNAFMAVANLSPFLSLPSLLNKKLELGGLTDEGDRNGLIGSSSTSSLASNVSMGSHQYQSLLKQQIRDLVLRRKSLVREDPEGEGLAELYNGLLPQAKLQQLQALAAESGFLAKQEPTCTTGLGYDQAMVRHECCCGNNASHVENGGRIQSIWSKLIEHGHVQKCEKVTAKKASLEQLQLVHSQTYTTFFAVSPTACLKIDANSLPLKRFLQLPCGGIGVDSDTYFNDASTQTAARLAAGTLIELSSQVAEGRLKNGFACIRPPGHHAEHEQAMGFCFFNNVAVAVKVLQTKYPAQCAKIAIIDWDVHHGNGTQLSFENDPNVLYMSLHRHDKGNFFPGTGSVTEVGKNDAKGLTVNVPFSGDVMRDPEYLAAWRTVIEPVMASFCPDFIIVSAGFDACHGHPNALGGYEVTPEMFGYMTKSLLNYASGKVVLALEGGYDLKSISEAAQQCVQALIGESDDAGRLSSVALESLPNPSAVETLQKVIAIHKSYWPALHGQEAAINTTEMQWRNLKLQVQMQQQQQQQQT